METTIMGLYRDYKVILGLYWDNGKENGNYYNGLFRVQYKVRFPEISVL